MGRTSSNQKFGFQLVCLIAKVSQFYAKIRLNVNANNFS